MATIIEIQEKGYEASNKENGQLESLKVALEATARGIKFLNVDLYKSDATVWKTVSDTEIYPPFSAIEGLSQNSIVIEPPCPCFPKIVSFPPRKRTPPVPRERPEYFPINDFSAETRELLVTE